MTNTTFLSVLLLGLAQILPVGNRATAQPTANPYEGCCGLEPVVFAVGVGSVYVPNVITSNSDGINDIFCPNINGKISSVVNFTIRDAATDSLIFEKSSLMVADASMQYEVLPDGWNGKNALGVPHKGLFKYSMTAYDISGVSLEIHGSACSVLCDSDAVILLENPGCLFPVQHDQNGGVDASLPHYEKKCLSAN